MATSVPAGYPGETYRPRFKTQDPAENGYRLGWLSCTCYAFAMGADRATLGKTNVSGQRVRELIVPSDTSGGTNLTQMDGVAERLGIPFVRRTGGQYATPREIAGWLYAGRGVLGQLWTGPLLGTTWQTTAGAINHAQHWNEGRGWRLVDGYRKPTDVLVYDPAGDGDNGRDQAPSWIPFDLLMRAAGRLNVGDPAEGYYALGAGRVYAGVWPDTEPHVILRFGAQRTVPFPDRTRAKPPAGKTYVNVRSRPDRVDSRDIVRRLDEGHLFEAWQVVLDGARVGASDHWRGNQDGTEWIPNARLDYIGGRT